MNSYFCAFVPGWNWWYLVAFLGFIIVAIVGYNKYYIYVESVYRWRLAKRYSSRFIDIMAGACAIILSVMIVVESRRGVVQFFDNRLAPGESPVWSLIVGSIMIPIIAALYWYGLMSLGHYVAKKRKATLKRRLRRH